MSVPIPAPRLNAASELKKPVPTPRRTVKQQTQPQQKLTDNQQQQQQQNITNTTKSTDEQQNIVTNTFSRRVRSLSNASKQIAEDIGELVQDKKKAVIEGTRQSVRKITKRFNQHHEEQANSERSSKAEGADFIDDDSIDIFSSISFQSPLSRNQSIYSNVQDSSINNANIEDRLSSSSDDFVSCPPPSHPPPPLPDDSIYDAPSSSLSASASGSTSNSELSNFLPITPENYESVFPSNASFKTSTSDIIIDGTFKTSTSDDLDSASGTELVAGTKKVTADQHNSVAIDLSRSESWKFYDSVTIIKKVPNPEENIYNDIIDATPPLNPVVSSSASTSSSGAGASNDNNNKVDSSVRSSMVSDKTVEVRNSMYENHVIVERVKSQQQQQQDQQLQIRQQQEKKSQRPSDSIMLQFDPLRNECGAQPENDNPTLAVSYDIKMLEELLQSDLYGNMSSLNTLDNWSISNEDSESDDFLNPPPPPVRVDSLPEDEVVSQPSTPKEKSRTNWFTSSSQSDSSSSSNTKQSSVESSSSSTSSSSKKGSWWFKQVKEALEKAPEVMLRAGAHRNKDAVVQRPELEVRSFVHKKGMMYKVQGGPVEDLFGEYSGRWCVLQSSNLVCYSDNTCDTVKENFPAESVLSLQILQDPKFKYRYDNDDLHCFELNTTGKSRGGHIYGTRDIAERRIWMQSIAESLTKKFSSKLTTDYTRMGWAYLREGVSGKWLGAWILLSHRTLHYALDNQPVKSMDLRKARCITLQVYQESDNSPRTNDRGPNMVVDSSSMTLYLRMWTSRETKVWSHIVKLAAHNNGANLDQQQLTKNDIPVLVEKCINFIYARGSMSEGIYRRPGTGSSVSEILTKFRKDAWAVQLTDKYSEHDVATALKRFFRDLPEPLLSSHQRKYFYQVSLVKDKEDRVRMYKAALEYLPACSYKTAKKLLGHLHFIATQSKKNLMSVDNLASIWGPTLMHYEDKDASVSSNSHQQDTAVVKQLIELYRYIFPEDPGEIEQEKMMLQVLERYTKSPQGAVIEKKAGDFRVWIYFENKQGQPFNVAIGPSRTAYDVCVELSSKVKVPVHQLIIEEVVLSDSLVRPVHHQEKILDVVLRWGYWDEPDRKDNHLIVTHISKYLDFIQEKMLPVVSGELKFADNKSKHFKILMFEFSQAKLTYFKDRRCDVKLCTWNIEDVIWYLGHEPKRNPQSRWTVTFIETKQHPNRTKNSPYFGNIIAWNDPTTRANWLAAMLRARYQVTLTPPAMHVNLMAN